MTREQEEAVRYYLHFTSLSGYPKQSVTIEEADLDELIGLLNRVKRV